MPWRWIDAALVPAPDPARTGWLKEWTYAHRGLHSSGVPENSLAGARRAIAARLGIECDIQRSADDMPMVFHDWDLARLTGEDGETASRTSAELAALPYRGSRERVATLPELLETIAGRVPLLIEIKSRRGYDVERSCMAVHEALRDYDGLHAVMSFDPRVARWFRRHSPATLAGLVMREDEHGDTRQAWQWHFALWRARPDFVAYHIVALPNPMVAALRARGLPVLTWTVNSPETRERAQIYADAPIAEGGGLAESSGNA